MKTQLILLIVLYCFVSPLQAQKPFAELGLDNEVEVITLSNGRYIEHVENDTLRQIGSVMFNMNTNKVEYFIPEDDLEKVRIANRDREVSRFMAVDPVTGMYPWNSPYAFSENRVIDMIELEGLEIALPRTIITVGRPALALPRVPTIAVPRMPIPPVIYAPPAMQSPQHTSAPEMKMEYESAIDWNSPPKSPSDLGKSWEEITHEKNKSGSRDFKNKDTGEEIRWDPGKDGSSGFEGKNHWHRKNPNSKGNSDYYLDRLGNPVSKGAKPSHIVPGTSLLSSIPDIIQSQQEKVDKLKAQQSELGIALWNPYSILSSDQKTLEKYVLYETVINIIENYINDLNEYKGEWDDYNSKKREYYENCNCGS